MFCPCLEVFIQDRADPIFIPGNRHLAVIRGNRRSHAAKIGQRVIIHPDPVPDIAFGHSFSVKVITVGEGRDKDRDLCGLIWIPAVMQIKLLTGVIQFEIDAGINAGCGRSAVWNQPIRCNACSTGDNSLASFHLRHLWHCISATDASGSPLCGPEPCRQLPC